MVTEELSLTSQVLDCLYSHTYLLLFTVIVFIVWYIRDSFEVEDFDKKHVFVTGCDSGFGNLVAKQLDRQGFNVIAACLTEKGASDLRIAASSKLKTVLLNVTDSTSIDRAVELVQSETGERGLYGLINNAGRSIPIGPTDWMQVDDFRKVLDVNLLGVVEVTLKFLPLLKRARGRVVNVASILGRLALVGGGYCPSKYGVEAFSDSLRQQMKYFGVKVSIIEPGFFETGVTRLDLIDADLQRLWDRLPADVRDFYGPTYLEKFTKAQAFTMNIVRSRDLSKVTWCMQHALKAQYPRTRYAAGWDAKLLWIPLSYLPAWVGDFVINVLLPAPQRA